MIEKTVNPQKNNDILLNSADLSLLGKQLFDNGVDRRHVPKS